MKKSVLFVLVMLFTLSLCACEDNNGSAPNSVSEVVVSETEKTLPEETFPEEVAPDEIAPEEIAPEEIIPEIKHPILEVVEQFDADDIASMIEWQNNNQNGAMFSVQDGWIYGTSSDSEGNVVFVKCRTDFTDWTILDYGWVYLPYVVDGYVYYMLYSPKGESESGFYRMRVSGEGKEKLSDIVGHMQFWADRIYLSKADDENTDEGNHLYSINLDGSNVQKVIDKPVFHWFVFADYVLYQDDNDNESLHITDFNGNDVKLNDEASYWPIFDGQYIYYVKEVNEVRSIWRIDIDGQNDTKISDCSVSKGFILYGDKIYFVYEDDSDRIYSINKDGSGLRLITQDKDCAEIQFLGGVLKYTDLELIDGSYYIDEIVFCSDDGSESINFAEIE